MSETLPKVNVDYAGARPRNTVYYTGRKQSYIPDSPRESRCNPRCCCWSWICIFFTIIVAIGIVALVVWLLFQPKTPHYSVYNVQVTGLNASLLTATATSVNTDTTFVFQAQNPNSMIGIYYDKIDVNIEILGVAMANGNLTTFYQGHKNTTYMTGSVNSGPVSLDEFSQGSLVSASKAGKVPIGFTVDVKATLKVASLMKYPKLAITVKCTSVVNPSSKITSAATCSSKVRPRF